MAFSTATGVSVALASVVPLATLYFLLRVIRPRPKHWTIDGKKVLITGASSGIGREIAYQWARKGAELILVARREAELQAVQEGCVERGCSNVHIVVADVGKQEDCKRMIETAGELFGGSLDCLILNAGISMAFELSDMSESDLAVFQTIMNVNYFGCVYPTFYAFPLLKASPHAKVVVTSSMAGLMGLPTRSGYSASKFALRGFFDALRIEWMDKANIDITLICPGVVNTDINRTRAGDATLNVADGMPVEECVHILTRAVCRGERIVPYTTMGKVGVYLHFFFPALADKLVRRKIQKIHTKHGS